MQKILFFLTTSFSFFVARGMEDTYLQNNLDTVPTEILKEILDANGKISKNDLITYKSYEDFALLNKTKPFKNKRNRDRENRIILNPQTISICDIAAGYFKNIAVLSLVNTKLNTQISLFKQDLALADEKILLKPNYFKNFFVYLMDIEGRFIIDGLDSKNNKLYINAYISFKQRICKQTYARYKYPAIYFDGFLLCPIEEYQSNYTRSTNTPIVSAIKNLANDSSNFDNVHHFFSVISQEAFSKDTYVQKKLAACLALCAYTYNHFNDFSYTEPRQTINFKNSWGFTMAEFNLSFDMGPMDQPSIPLHLIDNILNIKKNAK